MFPTFSFFPLRYYPDLTESERLVAAQTAGLPELAVQFLERCFVLIDSMSVAQTREEVSSSDHKTTRAESMNEMGLLSTLFSVLQHCSGKGGWRTNWPTGSLTKISVL